MMLWVRLRWGLLRQHRTIKVAAPCVGSGHAAAPHVQRHFTGLDAGRGVCRRRRQRPQLIAEVVLTGYAIFSVL